MAVENWHSFIADLFVYEQECWFSDVQCRTADFDSVVVIFDERIVIDLISNLCWKVEEEHVILAFACRDCGSGVRDCGRWV